MANAGWSRRSLRSWWRCEHVGPTVVCGPLADRRAAAAARRELAARAHCALLLLRNDVLLSTCSMVAAGRCWCLLVTNSSIKVQLTRASQSARHARARRRGQNASWAAHHPPPAARGALVYLVFGVGQHVAHLENGLLKIFRLVCGSSAQAPSCWRERRRQTSWAAAAGAAWPSGRACDISASQLACT